MRIAHFPLDFRPRNEGRHRVHHQHIDGAAAHQHLGDFQRLFAGVGLGDQQVVGFHPQLAGVLDIEGVLGVDEGGDSSLLLRLGGDMQGQGGFPGGFRAEDLDDPAARYAADSQGDVQAQRTGGDRLHAGQYGVFAQAHDAAFAELLLDLPHGQVYGPGTIILRHKVNLQSGYG